MRRGIKWNVRQISASACAYLRPGLTMVAAGTNKRMRCHIFHLICVWLGLVPKPRLLQVDNTRVYNSVHVGINKSMVEVRPRGRCKQLHRHMYVYLMYYILATSLASCKGTPERLARKTNSLRSNQQIIYYAAQQDYSPRDLAEVILSPSACTVIKQDVLYIHALL